MQFFERRGMDKRKAIEWSEIHEPADVILLSAPFTSPPIPSVALSIFRKILVDGGLKAKVIYPMFLMTHLMGAEDTRRLADLHRTGLYKEYCFAHLTDRPSDCDPEQAAALMYPDDAGDVTGLLRRGREAAEITVEATAQKIIAMEPKVLACSSIYSQLCCSLAVCRRVKELRPDIRTIIGGFIHAERGTRLLKNYTSLDYVSLGEGDETMLETCRVMMGLDEGPMPYGVLCRNDLDGLEEIPYRMTLDMNSVPMPVYDDYMEEVKLLEEGFYDLSADNGRYSPDIRLYLEGSRGCWWGQKHPCSFCALNGLKNVFRSKDPEKIYDEIKTVAEKYPGIPIQLTDNILSAGFIKEVLPRMAADGNSYHLFAEIKSNMKDSDMEAFRKAGIYELQPGIESLNDHLLELMGKGNTAVNHVNLLKMGRRYGLTLRWNILCGVPGEDEEDYLEMAELIPKLYHFNYPFATNIVFDRNSCYDNDAEKYGLELVPMKGMEMIYGDDPETISDMSFSFDNEGSFAQTYEKNSHLYSRIAELCAEWEKLCLSDSPPVMRCVYSGDMTMIRDTRPVAQSGILTLDGLHSDLYRLMEAPVTEKDIKEKLPEGRYSDAEIREAIMDLEDMALIEHLSGRYLALAVPVQ